MKKDVVTFVDGRDRLFESIFDLAISNEAFFGYMMMRCGKPLPQPGDAICMLSSHCPECIGLPVSPNYGLIMEGRKPKEVQVLIMDSPKIPDALPLGFRSGDSLSRIQARLISPIFLKFYETYRGWWVNKLNRDPSTWPMVMQFSRVIRNAIGHQMRIDWASPNLGPAEWRGLSYSHADNGKHVIGVDLSVADLFFLLVDLSDELDRLGCPIEP